MKHLFFKRALALVLTLMLLIGSVPAGSLAAETHYNDTSGHWAASAIDQWSDYGVLNGHLGRFRPGDPITRGEMAAVLTRVIGCAAAGKNQFSDVESGKWYYEYVVKLAAAGIMVGADGKARLQDNITREEAATLFARAFTIAEKIGDPHPFKDADRISAWAAGYVGGLHTAGYIDGKPGGNFDPQANITRAEVVTILDNMASAFYRQKGEYTGNVSGNALVNTAGVTLRNLKISGSLYLTEGIGLGNAVLNDITVAQTTYIRGGGSDSNSVLVTGGDLGAVELDSLTNTLLALSSDTLASKIIIRNTGKVTRGDAEIAFDATKGLLELSGTFDNAVLNADGTVAVTAKGIEYAIIPPGAVPMKLMLTEGSVIKAMELYDALSLTGTGQIDRLAIHASGSEVDGGVKVKLESIILEDGLTVIINHKTYTGTGGVLKAGTAAGGSSGGGGGGSSGGGSSPGTPPNNGKDAVTVTFHTDGGSEIAPIQVLRGKTLSAIPMPIKENYAFIGWYKDQALSQDFYSEVPIEQDLTLYANYTQRSSSMKIYTDPNKYIEDCPAGYTVSVVCAVPLTNNNLSEYVELTSSASDLPKLQVTGNNGVYTLSSLEPYTAGVLYELTLLSEELRFSAEDDAVRKLSFRIHKDETKIIKMNEDLVYVLWADVTDRGEGVYSVLANQYAIKTGDVVCIWDGDYNSRMKYRNVVLATLQEGEGGSGQVILLNTEASQVGDVFDELDLYVEQGIPLEDYLDQIDTNKIAEDAKNSPGARQLAALLNQALAESPTIKTLSAGEAYFLTPSETAEKDVVPVDLLFSGIDDLEVTCTVGGTDNANFPQAQNAETVAKWGKDYSPVLILTFKYTATIQNMQVEAALTFKEYLSASLQGGGRLYSPTAFDFDYAINMYSQTDIFMSVLIKSVATSEYEYDIDVTEEINKLIQGNQDDDADDPADILKKVLGDKGDYIDLVEANITDIPIQIIPEFPVAEIHILLDFVVKANFAAGISADATLLNARQIGIAGNSDEGYLKTYNNELLGNNRYAIDIYAAGYVGCKTGLKGSVTISFIGLEDLAKMGTSLEFGGYVDLYGFAKASILKTYPNDYVNSGRRESSLTGALYLDLGLYLEQELFAESVLLSARAGFKPIDLKFPLLSFGERYVLSKYLNNEPHILMNTESLPLSGSNGLLSAEFIDITTGEKVTGSFADPANFYIQYSSPYFSTQNNAITVNKALLGPDIKRLDTTAYIYYDGGALTFTGNREIFYDINNKPFSFDTPKTVKLTWIDSSIDPSQVPDIDTVKATYVASIDGTETVLAEETVLLGEIPGSIDLFDYAQRYKITGYANNFNEAIEKDTVYKIYMTPYQRLVSFITYYDDQWHFEVFPVNSNESPVPPAKYNASTPNLNFSRWLVGSGNWGYTKGNYYSLVPIPLGNALAYGNDHVFTSLDPAKPLFSFAGTLNDCYDAYYKQTYQGQTFSSLSLAVYDAEYQKENYTITIEYPAMQYTVYGETIKHSRSAWDRTFAYGDLIVIPGSDLLTYYGCEMLGWDTNGDGIVDYDPQNPPAATRDMTFTAVMKVKTFEVAVQDYAGETTEVLTVNIGNLPDILSTRPAHPGGEQYKFLGWQVSKASGESVIWDQTTDPGVYENWTIKPVYTLYNTVNFKFFTNGIPSTSIFYLPAGTYNVSDYIFITPSRPSDERYDYTFTGWDCGDTFTVTEDLTINALFSETLIVYTLNFTTPYGQLTTGGTTHTIPSTFDEYAWAASIFIADNSEFETATADGRTYTFLEWYLSSVDNVNHVFGYTAVWRAEVQNYTVLFDGGEGYYKNTGAKTLTMEYLENTVAHVPGIDSFIKPEDNSSTYILAGWRDQDNIFYDSGALYTVNKDLTFTAEYAVLEQKSYTVRFDAAGGEFPGGESIIERTCHYNDLITDPPVPTKAADPVYSYTFEGWEPEIVPVTGNTIYTAKYQRSSDAELPAGIKISDGTTTEDINLQTIPGYTYALDMNFDQSYVPTLRITGNGLTVSGAPDDPSEQVRIFIDPQVTDVRFDDLSLSISNDNLIYAEGENTSGELTITIAGLCSFYDYGSYQSEGYRYSFAPIESKRNLKLLGEDAAAELQLDTADGASGIICGGSAVIQNLNLTVNMVITQKLLGVTDNRGKLPAAFHNGKYSGSNWSFLDSTVTVDTDGRGFGNSGFGNIGSIDVYGCDFSLTSAFSYIDEAAALTITDSTFDVSGKSRIDAWGQVADIGNTDGIITGAVTIRGESAVNIVSDAIAKAELIAGSLTFDDFTGVFEANCLDTSVTLPAVLSEGTIKFLVQGVELPDPTASYGVHIGPVSVDGYDYYTFVDENAVPLPSISF